MQNTAIVATVLSTPPVGQGGGARLHCGRPELGPMVHGYNGRVKGQGHQHPDPFVSGIPASSGSVTVVSLPPSFCPCPCSPSCDFPPSSSVALSCCCSGGGTGCYVRRRFAHEENSNHEKQNSHVVSSKWPIWWRFFPTSSQNEWVSLLMLM